MHFLLFDSTGRLVDDHIDVTSAIHRESIDGEWSDSLQLDVAGTVEKGYYIAYRDDAGEWHEYRVTAPDELREDSVPACDVQALNSVTELAVTRPIVHFHETGVTLRRAVEYALLDTRWQPGELATGLDPLDELTMDNTDGWSMLQQIASTWGLELYTSVEMASNDQVWTRKVNLVEQRGTITGKRFEYGADLPKMRRTCTDREVALRIIPIGKTSTDSETGVQTRVTIEEVNGGRDYLEADNAASLLQRWGVPDRTGRLVYPTKVVSYSDAADAGTLYNLAVPDMKTWGTPKVQYEATVAAFRLAGVRDPDALRVGDTVQIVDTTFNPALRLQGRVAGVEEDLLGDDTRKTITLGSIIESLAERQTINAKTAQTVAQGKPVWDASASVAGSASSAASQAVSQVTGLTGQVSSVRETAAAAQATASRAVAEVNAVGGMTDVVFKAAEFASSLSVVKPVTGLPVSMVAGPPDERAQIGLWGACRPVVSDHDTDPAIPVGSIRVDVETRPTADLTIRLAALKGAAS